MVKSLLAAVVVALAAPAGAQVSAFEALRGLANAPAAADIATPPSQAAPSSAATPGFNTAVETIWRTMTSNLSPIRRRFLDEHVTVIVIPRDMLLVDKVVATLRERLPEGEAAPVIADFRQAYAERTGSESTDRVPHIPRGYTGDYRIADGRTLVFVGEENLDDQGEWDNNGSRLWRVGVHELAHSVQRTFSDEDWAFLKKFATRYYSTTYHDGDEREMYAEFTEIWFGVHQKDLNKMGWSVDTVPAEYAPVLAFLEQVYGPARNVRAR